MSSIAWLQDDGGGAGETWNPIRAQNLETNDVGWHCEPIHLGCKLCYAERQNVKLGFSGGTGLAYKPGHRENIRIYLDPNALLKPLRWKKPKRIFVCSMTDLFGAWVPDAWLDAIFAVMAMCPQHTFIVLTKRPERQKVYWDGPYHDGNGVMARIADKSIDIIPINGNLPAGAAFDRAVGPILENGQPEFGYRRFLPIGPLKNVWSGVSCSMQEDADKFLPILLTTEHLAKRIVSLEPLLEAIDLTAVRSPDTLPDEYFDALRLEHRRSVSGVQSHFKLDWVIVGGESGAGARSFDIDWGDFLIKQCAHAGTAVFIKQIGSNPQLRGFTGMPKADYKGEDWSAWPEHLKVRQWPIAVTIEQPSLFT